ncbi:MAG: hypothetical protein AB7P04_15125 [Bacteriovoracia bacterium]
MKFKSMWVVTLGFIVTTAAQAEPATFFRVWQGFKKPELTQPQFREAVGPFMQSTLDTYLGKGLNNYFVAMPPLNKPAFVPDEFALVGMTTEAAYREVRATPAGQAYGEKHWELFDKNTSKSAPFLVFDAKTMPTLAHNTAYDIIGDAIDWTAGHTTFFLGLRKPDVKPEAFLRELASHVAFVARTLKPLGLKGYIIIAHENYEIAYLHWESKEKADTAFATQPGRDVAADAGKILESLMFQAAEKYEGVAKDQSFYSTVGR